MTRLLAIDFGERRIGIATGETAPAIASPLCTLRRRSDRQAISEILRLAEAEEVEALVLGEPRLEDGTVGEAAERVRRFQHKLRAETELPIHLVPELLTSVEAAERLEARASPRGRNGLDAVAAQVILEEYLERLHVSGDEA